MSIVRWNRVDQKSGTCSNGLWRAAFVVADTAKRKHELPDQEECGELSSGGSPSSYPDWGLGDERESSPLSHDLSHLQRAPSDLQELKTARKYVYYGPIAQLPFSNYCFTAVYNTELEICFRTGTVFALPQKDGQWILSAITGRNANNPAASAVCGIFCSLDTEETATANISWLGLKNVRRDGTAEERRRSDQVMSELLRVPKPIRTPTPRNKYMDSKITVFRAKQRNITGDAPPA